MNIRGSNNTTKKRRQKDTKRDKKAVNYIKF